MKTRKDFGPDERLLTVDEVADLVRYSRVHIYRLVKGGEFPRQIHVGPHRVGWLASEVRAWLSERVAIREETP